MRKRKKIDKVTQKIKCPALTCRSANVQIVSKGLFSTKYQCNFNPRSRVGNDCKFQQFFTYIFV